MKKILIVVGILAVLSILIALIAIPARAGDPAGTDAPPPGQDTGQVMKQACGDGDWEAMGDAARGFHGEELSSMPCHDEGDEGMMGGSPGSYSMMW